MTPDQMMKMLKKRMRQEKGVYMDQASLQTGVAMRAMQDAYRAGLEEAARICESTAERLGIADEATAGLALALVAQKIRARSGQKGPDHE